MIAVIKILLQFRMYIQAESTDPLNIYLLDLFS